MKTICIDARLWGIKHTGIGRYIENLVARLPRTTDCRLVLIVPPSLKHQPELTSFEKVYARFHPYTFLSLIEMHWLLLKVKPDLLHVPHLTVPFLWPGKIVITVHDLIKHYSTGPGASTHHPLIYWFKYIQYLIMSTLSIRRAAHIFTPSHYWKEILIKKYSLPPSKITVTYEGVSTPFLSPGSRRSHPLIPRPYIVYTGNLYPHKNVPLLIEAVESYNNSLATPGRPLHLAIICARSIFENRLPSSRWVRFLGYQPDEELVYLYRHAGAFVFPSLIEGFGLPGLEAMAVGCPVIAANATCLPEVYDDAALYFEPTNPHDLVDKIHLLLTHHSLRQELIAKGKTQVRRYSWDITAEKTWQIYQKMLP